MLGDGEHSKRRQLYLWICLSLGLLGVLVWAGAYACVYPTLSKGINEHIAALTVFDNQSPTSGSNRSPAHRRTDLPVCWQFIELPARYPYSGPIPVAAARGCGAPKIHGHAAEHD